MVVDKQTIRGGEKAVDLLFGALADPTRRDILGPWVFDYDLHETVTVLSGLTERLGSGVTVEYATGVRPVVRPTPSIFDAHGGNKPVIPEDFDDDARLKPGAPAYSPFIRPAGAGR